MGDLALRWMFRAIVVAYLFFLVAWPLSLVVRNTFTDGFESIRTLLEDQDTIHAFRMTGIVAATAVVIKLVNRFIIL